MFEFLKTDEHVALRQTSFLSSVYASKISEKHAFSNLRGLILQRREAILVLTEICKCIPNDCAVSYMLLSPTKNATNPKRKMYDLHIKLCIDDLTRDNIEAVTKRRGLSIRKDDGNLFVTAMEQPIEIST